MKRARGAKGRREVDEEGTRSKGDRERTEKHPEVLLLPAGRPCPAPGHG